LSFELHDFFSLLFMSGYPKCELVKLTRVSLHFLTQFFLFNLVFFTRSFFFKSIFFILISCRKWRADRVNLSGLGFFFLIFDDFFFHFHHFALYCLSLSFVIFLLLLLFCYFESGLVKLTRISLHFLSQYFFI
jgi:hypothetical protein